MKKCPFCAEEIQDDAIKCKHCMEFLGEVNRSEFVKNTTPWYFRKSIIIIAFLCVGPLALPLVWWHPTVSRGWKIGITIGMVFVSWLLYYEIVKTIELLEQSLDLMGI